VTAASATSVRHMMLMSVHPVHIANMRAGAKTVELRRTRPAVPDSQPVILYSTTPQAALVAACRIEQVSTATPAELWPGVSAQTAIDRSRYDLYFHGAKIAVALHLADFVWLTNPIPLAVLRLRRGFHPPQTWHFLDRPRLTMLIGDHPDAAAVLALLSDTITDR
jgi:predicted transcriptional regulator